MNYDQYVRYINYSDQQLVSGHGLNVNKKIYIVHCELFVKYVCIYVF